MTNQTIARIYQYIGMAYFHEKEYDKTSINLKQAYDIVININDKISTGILIEQISNSVNGLGAVYYETDDYDLSLYYYSQAMELYESILPPIHQAIGMTLNNIGLVYCNTDYHQRALEYLFLVAQIREKSLSRAHPGIADTYCNMAMTYTQMRMYESVLEDYKKAIQLHE
ncbi:unnamed protein product [Rotaria sp. Silwood2]|nr:unnamed protein product [Rotaria sp. Silwood2]CAF3248506.1 unnamed protein product [Rotaria sp. Silwood2]CAF4455432.1 unnamed protein product [Rotaria sp. Silwood2]